MSRTGPISETWSRFAHSSLAIRTRPRCHQLWEAWVMLGVAASVVGHARLGQQASRRDKAVDPPLWLLVPADIECSELGKELQLAVRQMVVDPPCHCLPRGAGGIAVGKPRHNDRSHCADKAIAIATIPDMPGGVAFVRAAAFVACIAEGVDRRRTIG